MTKAICIAAIATSGLSLTLPAEAAPQLERHTWRYTHCRYESWDGHPGFTETEIHKLIACATSHFPVVGGYGQAHYISERESSDTCRARNAYSSATGLFQVVQGTWDSWRSHFTRMVSRWGIHADRARCRNNALLSIYAAHRWSWSPWS